MCVTVYVFLSFNIQIVSFKNNRYLDLKISYSTVPTRISTVSIFIFDTDSTSVTHIIFILVLRAFKYFNQLFIRTLP